MMNKKILIRFGDLMLKGKNIQSFLRKVKENVHYKLRDLDLKMSAHHDRIYLDYKDEDEQILIKRLNQIPGLASFSIVYTAASNLDEIIETASKVIDLELKRDDIRFKIETKRADKTFPLTSQEITIAIAGKILANAKRKVIVDVYHPEEILHIELRKEHTFIYLKSIKAMGGFPGGVAGKGLLMMSGGIDSSVAAYLAMKQGLEIELFHFESTPLTALESVQKVIDLAKILSYYMPREKIKLHLVPFTKIHQEIMNMVPQPYVITVMRRMMYRLSERYAKINRLLCIINGESIGQVASQTLQAIKTTEAVTQYPIIRPLITMDKSDIIEIAKKIDTFDISIRPFEDCCSIYVPKSPATKPMHMYALRYESLFPYEAMLSEALLKIVTLEINQKSQFDITSHGFSLDDAIKDYREKSDQNDHLKTK
jgi:tRNA uracil 4-sulfurtransferase